MIMAAIDPPPTHTIARLSLFAAIMQYYAVCARARESEQNAAIYFLDGGGVLDHNVRGIKQVVILSKK